MNFEDVIKNRYSVRKYKQDQIEKEKLDKILEAGRIAPTAKNYQPQHVYVIQSVEYLTKLKNVCKMTYDAPTVLLVCYDDDKACRIEVEEGFDSGIMDGSIVCCHMMLEAYNLGLGSVWVRMFNQYDLCRELNLPSNMKPVCLLCLGYPTEESHPVEKLHNTKKDISELVSYL